MFRTVSLLIFAAAMFLPGSAQARIRIVTTTTDLGDLARTVGGSSVSVETICHGKQDPHFVQAKPSYMVRLSRADLVVAVGLELEAAWLPQLIQGARNPKINPGKPGYLEASSAVKVMGVPTGPVDRSQGDIHPLGNPHYWLNPDNAIKVARLIASRLGELDPDEADSFRGNLSAFETRMAAATARWTRKMAPYSGRKIVSYHRTFNYFHQHFGLVPVGYVEERPGIPPAPAHLARLIKKMRNEGVPLIFHEGFYDRAMSELVASKSGAKLLVLPTSVGGVEDASSYEKLIDYMVGQVVAGLEAGS